MKFKHPKLEEYRYLETLGIGGQGKVVKVQDPSGRRIYALKIISPFEDSYRAEKEIETLEQFNHNNIVHIYDAGSNEEGSYILMQYMKHGNIEEYIQKHTVEIKEKLLLMQDVASALEYVHNNSHIHRDIKPKNIFVTDGDCGVYACLGDFGIVKELGSKTESLGIGTKLYWTPEMLLHHEEHSYQSDIYALGLTCYEMITGSYPYDKSSSEKFMENIKSKIPNIKPSGIDSSLPQEIDEFCLKAIAKNKEERYTSMDDFIRDLKKCVRLVSNDSCYDIKSESKSKIEGEIDDKQNGTDRVIDLNNQEVSSNGDTIDINMLDTNADEGVPLKSKMSKDNISGKENLEISEDSEVSPSECFNDLAKSLKKLREKLEKKLLGLEEKEMKKDSKS